MKISSLFKYHRIFSLYLVIISAAIIFVFTQNIAFWSGVFYKITLDSWHSYLFLATMFIAMTALMALFFSLILWGKARNPLLLLLLILCTIFNYYSYYYQIYMDRDMLINIIETNSGEVVNLVSFKLVFWLILGVIVPFFLLTRLRVKPISVWKSLLQRFIIVVISLILLATITTLFYKDYASFFRNNRPLLKLTMPMSYISSGISYARKQYADNMPFEYIAEDAKLVKPEGQEKTLFIIVVGETARSRNFSLNGYGKETNPRLAKQENLISFKNMYSCGTATAISVPCMFSKLTRDNFDKIRAQSQENVLDVLQKVGYTILWRENDNGCKGVCDRVPTEFVETYAEQPKSVTGFYYDEYLLTNLHQYIQSKEGSDEDLVIVLHMNGSHGPTYYQRYPEEFRHFSPSCDTNKIETCDAKSLENVYDNTIRYTDYVLNETIELLKGFDSEYETSMLYISDHGESLGENRFYLHGAPYAIAPDEQKHVPFIFWANDDFYQNRHLDQDCLAENAARQNYSQDNLFHSLLGLLSVETKDYDESMNLFKACERQ